MISPIEVRVGQIYAVARKTGVFLTVAAVALQKKTAGRLKARYTYATCTVGVSAAVRVVDTDVLRGRTYRLHYDPPAKTIVMDIGGADPRTAFDKGDECAVGAPQGGA